MRTSHLMSFAGGALLCGAGVLAWHQLETPAVQSLRAPVARKNVPAAPPAHALSTGVAALLSKQPVSLPHRKAYLSTIGYQLGQTDRMALLDSIGNTPPNGLSSDDWYSLANAILDVLRKQQPAMPEFTDRLVSLWRNRDLQPTLRDYLLQELREWVSDKDVRTMQEQRPEKLALIRQTFLDACTPGNPYCDPQSTTTGTALLALNEWTGKSTPAAAKIDPAFLEPMLLSYAKDTHAHRGVRATALQLGAGRNLVEILPLARDLARDTSTDLILRLAAISCLHRIGTPNDQKMLADLSKRAGADPLVRGALASALRASSTPSSTPNH